MAGLGSARLPPPPFEEDAFRKAKRNGYCPHISPRCTKAHHPPHRKNDQRGWRPDGTRLLKDSGGVMMGKRAMTPVFGMSDVMLEKKVDAVGIHAYVSVSLASAAKIKPR